MHLRTRYLFLFIVLSFVIRSTLLSNTQIQDSSVVEIFRDIVFAIVNGRELKLDLYLIKSKHNSPLIVTIHGGAFKGGNKNDAIFTKEYLQATSRGYAVASVEYRLSSEAVFPAAIQDIKGAIRWLKANSFKYGLDKNNFFAIGGSAGGSLSALIGTSWNTLDLEGNIGGNLNETSKVNAVVDLFGPVEFEKLYDQRKSLGMIDNQVESDYIGCDLNTRACKEQSKKAGAINYIDKEDPPIFILHGGKDPSIPINQSIDFYIALKNAGAKDTFIVEPNMGHGGPEVPARIPDYLNFFDKYLQQVLQINTKPSTMPENLYLYQNYPNPFNPSTIISYQIPMKSHITLKVFDLLGREIATLVNEEKPAGTYQINFDGSKLTSGIYFYKLTSGNFIQQRKMIILK